MSNEPIIILAGVQTDGVTYRLHPLSRKRLQETFAHIRHAPSVFVGFESQADFEALHGGMWGQVATMLTGLSAERLAALGRVVIRVPATGQEFEVTEKHVEDPGPVHRLGGPDISHV